MKALRIFDIDIAKLSNKKHQYEYSLDNSFFSEFEDSFIHIGELKAEVSLDKSEVLIQAVFKIKGFVELTCDRSLEKFNFDINADNKLIFKFGEEYNEITDEIIMIPYGAQKINVAQYIYEFIGLAVPMRKIHPKFILEDDDPAEEGTLIYSTSKKDPEEDNEDKEIKEEDIDPRWKILNNLKNNNN